MKKLKFVTRISKGKITIPDRFIEKLEGLDLLVTVEPVIVEKEDIPLETIKSVFKDLKEEDCSYCGIKPAEINGWCDECAPLRMTEKGYKKVLEEREKEVYDEMLGGEPLKPIQEVMIERNNGGGITLTFTIDKKEKRQYIIAIKDKHELKNALGGAQYADSFKLTIRSEPLYEELTSIVYYFFNQKYRLTDMNVHLDDYIDTYEKIPEKSWTEVDKKIDRMTKEKEWQKYEETKELIPKEEVDEIMERMKRGEITEVEAFKELRGRYKAHNMEKAAQQFITDTEEEIKNCKLCDTFVAHSHTHPFISQEELDNVRQQNEKDKEDLIEDAVVSGELKPIVDEDGSV